MAAPILWALLGVNALTFALFGLDKWLARRERRRVAEAHLLWLTFLGGAAGAWVAMRLFRHKTQKKSFRWKWFVACGLCLVWLGLLVRWWLSEEG